MPDRKSIWRRAVAALLSDGRTPGLLLLLAAAAGLLLANVLPAGRVQMLWQRPWPLAEGFALPSLLQWVNEGLMSLFFLAAGLEIRMELACGSLRGVRRAALPVLAAIGGVLVPACIYGLINHGRPQLSGWAVPTATDIAFATGVLAMLGPELSRPLRPFLLALAMMDDLIAVVVVLLFYSHGLASAGLPWLLAATAGVLLLRRRGGSGPGPMLAIGLLIWLGLWRCGVHPALAGMLLGLLWPAGRDPWQDARRMLHALEPWVAFAIMPAFALLNASVDLHGMSLTSGTALRVLTGVVAGLVLGKPAGILLASWLAVRTGAARLPQGMDAWGLLLCGVLAGIGLTMAMFISALALPDAASQGLARLAVVIASVTSALCAGAVGGGLARRSRARRRSRSAAAAPR